MKIKNDLKILLILIILGVVKIWKMKSGSEVYKQENSLVHPAKEEGGLSITHLLYNAKSNSVAIVSADHNIIIHSLETFHCKKQVIYLWKKNRNLR